MLLLLGATENAEETVMVFPLTALTERVSTTPVGRITEMVGAPAIVRPVVSSSVMTVVVAELMRPPRRTPARIGSETLIIWPGRTITPASSEVVNVITSPSCCSV